MRGWERVFRDPLHLPECPVSLLMFQHHCLAYRRKTRATHWTPHQWLTLLGDHDPAPTSRSRHAIARRRLSDRFAATTGRHLIRAYSITFDS